MNTTVYNMEFEYSDEELVDRWTKTGLLDSCNDDDESLRLSQILERTFDYVVDNRATLSKDIKETIFPYVAKSFYSGRPIDDIEEFIHSYYAGS